MPLAALYMCAFEAYRIAHRWILFSSSSNHRAGRFRMITVSGRLASGRELNSKWPAHSTGSGRRLW
jgi:hypothetical protein